MAATMGWPTTGRDRELKVIEEALNSATAQGVLIAGPPGVGRSRLAADAAAAAARSRWSVHPIVATLAGRTVPLSAFAPWPDTSRGVAHTASEAMAAVAALAKRTPVLLDIDDAHLLDDVSAFVVHQLVSRRVVNAVITVRTGDELPDAVLRLWKDGLLRRIDLPRWTVRAFADVLTAALTGPVSDACVHQLWDLTQGDASLLTALVDHEAAAGNLRFDGGHWRLRAEPTVTAALRDVFRVRIGPVSESVGDVLELVAVAQSVNRLHLAMLTDRQAASDAERRGLIVACDADPEAFRIRHPLYAKTVLTDLGPLQRRRLMGRLVTAMAAPGSTGPVDPARLGVALLDSDLEPQLDILRAAAETALRRLDLDVAERCAGAGAQIDAGHGMALTHAYCLLLLSRYAESRCAQSRVDRDLLDVKGLREASTLGAVLGIGPDGDDQARAIRGLRLACGGDPRGALAVTDGIDDRQLDGLGRIAHLGGRCLAHTERGEVAKARRDIDATSSIVVASLDALDVLVAAETQVPALILTGHLGEAAVVAQRTTQLCQTLSPLARASAAAITGMVALARGDLGQALQLLAPAAAGPVDEILGAAHRDRYRALYATAAARSGLLDDADSALTPDVDPSPAHLLASAWIAAQRGQRSTAQRTALQAAERACRRGEFASEIHCEQVALQLGATQSLPRLAALHAMADSPRAAITVRYARALAAQDGDGLDVVSRDYENLGDLLAAADSADQAAAAHRHTGGRSHALEASARANRLAQACGLQSTHQAISGPVAPFTRRQREIAGLILDGLSNRAIADALSLSVRTVEGHVYRASFRAGVPDRKQLAELIIRFKPSPRPARPPPHRRA